VIKLLTLLLDVISRFFGEMDKRHWKQQGRQEAIKESADEVQKQVELAEHVATAVDPDHDRRMRSRFDAASRDQ
jgi:Na+-transporting methylmalonyl-CoA/oxaloacetate decarboxylase gamma subunit